MAGHNKWSQIKRKKGANDAQRGKIISKHVRAIQTAVRNGGSGDPNTNLQLRNAVAAAKADTVPVDNIDRAIERGLGGGDTGTFDEVVYEGYGPNGVAMLIEALTDNRNRTAGEVRHAFNKYGGNMSGSTAWQFDSKGMIVFDSEDDQLAELAIDFEVDDIEVEDGVTTVYTQPTELFKVVEQFQQAGFVTDTAQLTKLPQTLSPLSEDEAGSVVRFLEALEDLDDVQNVYTTADLTAISVEDA